MVFKPICFQSGIALLCCIFVFPQSVSGQFRSNFGGVLNPLLQAVGDIESLFSDASTMATFGTPLETPKDGRHPSIHSIDFGDDTENKLQEWADRSDEIRVVLLKSLAGMQPLNAQQRYLDVDISYGRIPGKDLREMFNVLASVQARASGFSFFFNTIVNQVRRTHLDSRGFNAQRSLSMATISRPNSRPASRAVSRQVSREDSAISLKEMRRSSETPHASAPGTPQMPTFDFHGDPRDGHATSEPGTPDDSESENVSDTERRGRRGHRHHESLAHRLLHSLPHSLPLSLETSPHRGRSHSRDRKKRRKDGNNHSLKGSTLSLLEHLRKAQQPVGVYESQRYMDLESGAKQDMGKVIEQLELLSTGALPLVKALREALAQAAAWTKTSDRKRHDQSRDMAKAIAQLRVMLEEFKGQRGGVTKPYRHLFDPSHQRDRRNGMSRGQQLGLFYCLVAQYHLVEFSDALLRFLDMIHETDQIRQKRRLWVPGPLRLFRQFRASVQREHSDGPDEAQENTAFDHDEDGAQEDGDILSDVRSRNPDYKPYGSGGMMMLSKLARLPDVMFSRSAMFAVKAGVLGCLMSLPAFLSSSVTFYNNNRGIWCTIMAQMTLAVFAGDTFSSWISRLLASFWGGLIGLIAWYIGSGSGKGNPYGLAVVTAILFPPMMLLRVHWPGPVLTSVVFCTSVNLVIGYSYLNAHLFRLGNASWGFEVAWLRFVCVVIGITAAWIFSLGRSTS